jgi:hypothetical protein
MKKQILLIVTLLFFVVTLNAQSSWHGFLKPIKSVVRENNQKIEDINFKFGISGSDSLVITPTDYMFFRPTFIISFAAIDFYEKPVVVKSLEIAGLGISYGKFSAEDNAYCLYSVNALLITSYKIGGVENVKIDGAITVDVFNKFIGGGCGYVDGKFMPLITISRSF